jgi:SNF2 family DNA or RNA helicase
MIRSRRTANARAVCALHATHRWCITGTPIQNRLGDLSSILRFLKVSPYDEAKTFDAEISQPWKSRMDETALRKLQTLMKMIALRRPRTVISLPHRSEIIESIAFTAEETKTYEQTRLGTIKSIDSALSSDMTVGSAYINAFQRINDLRYICNHGKPPLRKNHSACKNLVFDATSFRQELDKMLDVPTPVCLSCGTDIQEDEDVMQGLEIPQARPDGDVLQLCRHCLTQRLETTVPSPLSSDTDDTITTCDSAPVFSSKMTALVSQLQRVPTGDKWCDDAISPVVFF